MLSCHIVRRRQDVAKRRATQHEECAVGARYLERQIGTSTSNEFEGKRSMRIVDVLLEPRRDRTHVDSAQVKRAYFDFGGIRMPPSTRMVSAFIYELPMSSPTIDPSSLAWPSRCGNKTSLPSAALKASDASPVP